MRRGKKYWIALCLGSLGFVFLCALFFYNAHVADPVHRISFYVIHKGMTANQVELILGRESMIGRRPPMTKCWEGDEFYICVEFDDRNLVKRKEIIAKPPRP